MPRLQSKPPAYCRHTASGQAVVRIHGRDRYLGRYGSSESYEAYERALAEWRAGQAAKDAFVDRAASSPGGQLSVNELPLAYLEFGQKYDLDGAGRPTREPLDVRYALRPLGQNRGCRFQLCA